MGNWFYIWTGVQNRYWKITYFLVRIWKTAKCTPLQDISKEYLLLFITLYNVAPSLMFLNKIPHWPFTWKWLKNIYLISFVLSFLLNEGERVSRIILEVQMYMLPQSAAISNFQNSHLTFQTNDLWIYSRLNSLWGLKHNTSTSYHFVTKLF